MVGIVTAIRYDGDTEQLRGGFMAWDSAAIEYISYSYSLKLYVYFIQLYRYHNAFIKLFLTPSPRTKAYTCTKSSNEFGAVPIANMDIFTIGGYRFSQSLEIMLDIFYL